jgi:DNA polymerase III sliding clamp (beta) subunit (PCNA family)
MTQRANTTANGRSTDREKQSGQTQSCLTEHRSPVREATEQENEEQDVFELPTSLDLSTLSMSTAELEEAMTLPYHAADDLIEHPPGDEPVFAGALDYSQLAVLAKHLIGVAHESRVAITMEGWYVSVVNPSNVAMVRAWLPAEDWTDYNCEQEGVIGLSWDGNGGSVSRALKHFGCGASIDIRYEENTIVFDDGIPIEFSTFDPASTRQTPEMPELVLPNSFVLPGVDVDELTKRIDDIAEHVAIVGHPDADSVELRAEGDTAVVRKEYTEFDDLTEFDGSRKHNVFETYVNEADRSVFSLDYLRSFLSKPRKSDLKTGYKFRFGTEFPVKIERELGDEGFLRYLQAPRIPSD